MSTNQSQSGHSPSETTTANNEHESNIDQLLSLEIVTTSQSSSIHLHPTDMIANIQEHDHELRRQHTQRGRPHQQQFQQRQERQRQQQEEQRRLREQRQRQKEAQRRLREERQRQQEAQRRLREEQRQRQIRRREKRLQRYEQWLERVDQRRRQRERDEEYFQEMMNKDPLEEPMDDEYNEQLLEAYDFEMMNSQERKEIWEQQHLNELQGISAPRTFGAPLDELERFATFQEEQLMYDQIEQPMQIYEMESWHRVQE